MATGNVVAQMETVLSSTLNDLSIRNEVGDCIQDMLLDFDLSWATLFMLGGSKRGEEKLGRHSETLKK